MAVYVESRRGYRRDAREALAASGFHSLHPAVLFLYYAGATVMAMLLLHPIFLAVLLAAGVALNLSHGAAQRRRLVRSLPFYLLIGGAVALLNPLFSHRGWIILFYFRDQPITLESVVYGATAMLTLLVLLLLFLSFSAAVDADKLLYLLGSVLPRTALLTLIAIRFVPTLLRRLKQLALVQRTRGIDVASGSVAKRARDGMTLLRTLLMWSLEESLQTADSMRARGYGVGRRSAYAVYRMDRRDRFVLALLGVGALVVIALGAAGCGTLAIYPRMESFALSAGDVGCFAAMCLFLAVPFILNARESWLWKKFSA